MIRYSKVVDSKCNIIVCIFVAFYITPCPVNGAFSKLERNIEDLGQKVTLASMIGGEEHIPKDVIRKVEEFIAPGLNISTNERCRNHSEAYIKGLRNGETWAYQMLDSSAKLQSGLLTGNLLAMGNFDECIGVMGIETDFGQLNGKHCLATLKWENDTFMSTRELFKNVKRVSINSGSTCAIFSFFGVLTLTSTAYDLLKKGQIKEILIAFSLYTNGKKLLNTDTSKETIPCLHGIRFISICWIVLGHRYMVSTDGPAINLSFAMDFIKGAKSTLVVNSQLGVDTFLVMSGFLVSYVFLKQKAKSKGKSFNIPLFYLHRYIRLTPVLAVMVLLQVSLIDHMGSGPLWDTSNQFLTQLCKENWWSALLYVQNYVSGDRMHTQTHLALRHYIHGPKWDGRDKNEYVKTHTRFTPWVIGFGLGYIVFLNKNKVLKFNKFQVAAGWMLTTIGLLGPVYCILPFQQPDYYYNALESAFYSFVNTFLSWKAFQPFSRLTYCIYLVHFTFILYRQFSVRTPPYLDDMSIVSLFWSDMSFSILLALALSLMFEAPATVIEKILLSRGRPKPNATPDSSNVPGKSVEDGNINKGFVSQINSSTSFKISNMSAQ
ncbi:hypothetical protein C0J52_08663 [Blattella germanica]|nr:hypothetical protein C0J52_08663 [Blattella germanica]